jgi:hypothetical protein
MILHTENFAEMVLVMENLRTYDLVKLVQLYLGHRTGTLEHFPGRIAAGITSELSGFGVHSLDYEKSDDTI